MSSALVSTAAPKTRTGGVTVWLTGLPSAGKTTLALAVAAELGRRGRDTEVLDGDEMRTHLTAGLGFSEADRHTQGTRIGLRGRGIWPATAWSPWFR